MVTRLTIQTGEIHLPEFKVGMSVEMKLLTPDMGWLVLDLKDSDENIILHVNPRWDEKELVLNTCSCNKWGPEERPTGFDFSSGVILKVRIEAFKEHFKILCNGKVIHLYKHRLPLENIRKACFHCTSCEDAIKQPHLVQLRVGY